MAGSLDLYRRYERLSGPLRSLADTLYAFIPEKMLRSPRVNAYTDEVMKSQWLSAEQLNDLQFQRLKALCVHAQENTPYYKRIFQDHGFDAHSMLSVNDVTALPILTRDDIIAHGDELRSTAFSEDEVYSIETSGSTGTFLKFIQSKEYYDREYAFTERLKRWMGAKAKSSSTIFYRAIMRHPIVSDEHPPYEQYRNRLILSQFHTDDKSFAFYVKLLNKHKPEFWILLPSIAISLTRYCASTGEATFKPRAIMCAAENLLDEHRHEIEVYWGCKVYNRYGHSEGCISAGDCEQGGMHLGLEFGYSEFLRNDGSPAVPGELARIISTGFFTQAMPFIRYDTGDLAVLSAEECPCGRKLPLIERIDGRGDDVLIAKDGQKITALRSIFTSNSGVKHTQIIQEKEGEIEIRLVPGVDYREEVQSEILENLRNDAGEAFDVKFTLVDDIERAPSGKVRLIISKLRRDN
jgi:phenylacetate-coenzyme A ligase PaaK-like adenylate-forming protein